LPTTPAAISASLRLRRYGARVQDESPLSRRVGCLRALVRGMVALLFGLIAGAALNMGILYAGM
jgi:hypothetical protein